MKRCPDCRRDYYDDSLVFCLDDGARLLEGPASDSQSTAIIPVAGASSEAATRTFENQRPSDESLPTMSARRRHLLIGAAAVFATALIGWSIYSYYRPSPARQIESIAVMPLVNAAGNPDLEYLSDGITESLINSLSQIPTLSVKARSSVFTYKGKEVTPQQVGKELSVQAVLTGRMQQRGDQVMLNVDLVDSQTGNQLWGDQYTRKTTDLAHLQSDIAGDVSSKLKAKLTGAEQQKVTKSYTENTEAYQLYLRGRHHWNKRKAEDIKKSIEYCRQAIDKDPTYALAYAAMAEGYILVPSYGVGTPHEAYPKARAAALKAIEIDDALAEGHNALAAVMSNYDWKFAEAEAEWRKALALNPNYATGYQWYAEHLQFMGRFGEGLAEMKRAQALDPLSLIINGSVGMAYRANGQYDKALEQLGKTLEMDPNFSRTHLFLAETYQDMGRYEEAADEFAKVFALNDVPPDKATELAVVVKEAYRKNGSAGYSRAMAELLERNAPLAPPAGVMAAYWARAGEIDKAFAVLEKAYDERADGMLILKDRKMDPLKSDPRYKDLLRRVGLPE